MAGYLLDTNIVSYLVDARADAHRAVHDRLAGLTVDDTVSISILTCHELHRWLAFDNGRQALVEAVLADFTIEPLTTEGAAVFGRLMRRLRDSTGRESPRRASVDCMIAASALVAGRIVVSNDALLADLAGIEPGLPLENWAR